MSMMMQEDDRNMPIIELAYRPTSLDQLKRLQLTRAWDRALVTPENNSVAILAKLAQLNNMDLIITIDNADKVSGVMAAKDLIRFVAISAPNILSDFPSGLGGILPADLDKMTIRGRRPDMHWCDLGNHDTTEKPCSQHPPK